MTHWKEQYARALDGLGLAQAADQVAYDAIISDTKAFWAARPIETWPKVDGFAAWIEARRALLAAEVTVIEVLRWRCVAIRLGLPLDSIAPGHANLVLAPYVEQRSETRPDELDRIDFGQVMAERTDNSSGRKLH